MTRPDRQTAESLAERLSGLDLTRRLHLIAAELPGRLVFTTSLGVEDQALTHALAMAGLAKGRVEIVTLDTGRLFPETYDTWAETESAYGIRIAAYAPERAAAEAFVRDEGINGFRRSVAARQACCGFRKVEPLGRALDGASGWLTGLRAGQSANRAETPLAEFDPARGLIKLNPAGRLDPGAGRRLRARQLRPLQRPARPRLPVDRLRPLHPRGEARRARARRPLVVGAGRQEGMRPARRTPRGVGAAGPGARRVRDHPGSDRPPAGVRPMSAALAAAVQPSAPRRPVQTPPTV